MLARRPLGPTVAAEAVVLATPAEAAQARVLDRREDLASERIIADGRHAPLDARFVARVADAGGINMEVAGLRVFEKDGIDPRGQVVGGRDDRRRVVGNDHREDAAVKGPGRFTGLNGAAGGFLEGRIDEAIARAMG